MRGERDTGWLRMILFAIAIFLAVSLFALIGGRIYVRYLIKSKLTVQEYAELRRFFDDPVHFPVEWGQAPPFSGGLETERQVFREILSEWKGTDSDPGYLRRGGRGLHEILSEGGSLSTPELRLAHRVIKSSSPLNQAWMRFSSHPDFELEAIPILEPLSNPGVHVPDYLSVTRAYCRLCLTAHLAGMKGNWEEAFVLDLNILDLARRHPGSLLISHLIGISAERLGSKALARHASATDDEASLVWALRKMNELEETLHTYDLTQPLLVESIGALRLAERQGGYSMDVTPGKPPAYYWRQAFRKGSPMYYSIRGMTTSPYVFLLDIPGIDNIIARFLLVDELVWIMSSPNTAVIKIRANRARAEFELARLAVVNRIQELEGRPPVRRTDDLVPKWLSTVPMDPIRWT